MLASGIDGLVLSALTGGGYARGDFGVALAVPFYKGGFGDAKGPTDLCEAGAMETQRMNSLRMSFECIAGRTSELESKLQLACGRRSYGKLKLGLQRAGELSWRRSLFSSSSYVCGGLQAPVWAAAEARA